MNNLLLTFARVLAWTNIFTGVLGCYYGGWGLGLFSIFVGFMTLGAVGNVVETERVEAEAFLKGQDDGSIVVDDDTTKSA